MHGLCLSNLELYARAGVVLTAMSLAALPVFANEPSGFDGAAWLGKHCYQCHADRRVEGELDLAAAVTGRGNADWAYDALEQALDAVRDGRMPPRSVRKRPGDDERRGAAAWLEGRLAKLAELQAGDPGRVVIARLTRAEYQFVIRDLTGHMFEVGRQLPGDGGAGEGFANVGEAQSVTLEHLEKYLQASREVLSHLRASSRSGLRWSTAPLPDTPTPRESRQELLDRITFWYADQEDRLYRRNQELRRQTGQSHGHYLRAAWRGDDAVPGLTPATIRKWRGLLRGSPKNPLLAELAREWQALPPSEVVGEHGPHAAEIEQAFRAWDKRLAAWQEKAFDPKKLDRSTPPDLVEALRDLRATLGERNRRGVDETDLHTKTHLNAERNVLDDLALDPQYLNGPWGGQQPSPDRPDRPYFLTAAMVREAAPPAALAELRGLQAELIALAQPAAQDLASFLRTQGWREAREGARPSANLVADWDQASRDGYQRFLAAADQEEQPATAAARQALAQFARRAWRRPLHAHELELLLGLYCRSRQTGASYDAALKTALRAILTSPCFIYRGVEGDRESAASEGVRTLHSLELATRLSFFLWSSLPDDELLALAEGDRLRDPTILRAQVQRMLRDPRSEALATQFAGQWLGFADFSQFTGPDAKKFPAFTPALAQAMHLEATSFFAELFRENRSLEDLVQANWTYLNEPLARHYGIDGVQGEALRRVTLTTEQRGGVLGLGAVLTKTSQPLRTSPVHRGVWVLEQLLGVDLPAPPNAEPLSEDEQNSAGLSIPEQLKVHRANPNCAGCHDRIDPLGLALERYDPIGRWRTAESAGASNEAPHATDEPLRSPADLRRYLVRQAPAIHKQFCRKLAGYALSRGLSAGDTPLVDAMLRAAASGGPHAAIEALVLSPQFLRRRSN